ncbi:hypothetical protein FUAX_46370 (plasmid) [Fulvitalea axinellae]|uniref:Sulfotransferase n=1 Tax=Fulvitalea axinellae TaxID=1182444 RepID=A0AAU9DLY2_9BACT|nr:hypothetical protein FUAX_46370 [Fulvitalea axinellae]
MVIDRINPVIIVSSIVRSGTTLVQRLLNSSDNALVFGEHSFQDLLEALNRHLGKSVFFGHHLDYFRSLSDRVIEKGQDLWSADVLPPIDEYLRECYAGIWRSTLYHKEFAQSKGRSVWGVKAAGIERGFADMLYRNLPNAKIIWIRRDLSDCLASAKSAGIYTDPSQLDYFLNCFNEGQQLAESLRGQERFLEIEYQDLLKNPEETIEKLSRFTGAKGIRAEVLNKRLNSATGTYLKPAPLSEVERERIKETQYKPLNQ